MKHFIEELRRRGVLRIALVYLAGAWLVVQVLGTLVPAFGLPEASIRWVVVALAVAFVPVLALSWAFEWTAQGIHKESLVEPGSAARASSTRVLDRIIIAVFAVALGYFAFDRYVLQANREAPATALRSIAVLPFQTLDAEPGHEYFTDGVHEELIARLSKIDTLAVRSRTSVLPFRDRPQPVGEVARQLAVDAIVEGSVRHAGDRVLITAQLIDTRNDKLLWADRYEEALSVQNLFEIQSKAARQIAAALETRLSPEERSGPLPTESLEAYDRFLLGKYHYRKGRRDDLRASVGHFEAAVALDPTFAEAWDWLAYAHSHSATGIGWLLPNDAYPKAQAAALRALELDPGLLESRALLGYLRGVYDWDWPGALAALEHAVELAPDASGTVWSYAYVLSVVGRHDAAVQQVERFAAVHPGIARNEAEVASRLVDAGRYAEALERVERALLLGGEPGPLHDTAGIALIGLGRYDESVDRLERAAAYQGRSQDVLGRLGHAYARAGRPVAARLVLAELESRRDDELVSPVSLAYVYAGLDRIDEAFRLLEQAADERHRDVLGLTFSPLLAGVRQDPRYTALLARMGLPLKRGT